MRLTGCNFTFMALCLVSFGSNAENHYWTSFHNTVYGRPGKPSDFPKFSDAYTACEAAARHQMANTDNTYVENSIVLQELNGTSDGTPRIYSCNSATYYNSAGQMLVLPSGLLQTYRQGTSCSTGKSLNAYSGECEQSNSLIVRKQLGEPDNEINCNSPAGSVGNPINISNGNKFQVETDYIGRSIVFQRYYNGLSGLWLNTYSSKLNITNTQILLTLSDGRQAIFHRVADTASPELTELGRIVRIEGGWQYTNQTNDRYTFDDNGRLIKLWPYLGVEQTISYAGSNKLKVITSIGDSVDVQLSKLSPYQPLKVTSGLTEIVYEYDFAQTLLSIRKKYDGHESTRAYHYEDIRNKKLLTGITDERGVRFASWSYDENGRAVSSEHVGGVGKTQLKYTNKASVIINELGRSAKYNYEIISGLRRIISIKGLKSANCPASNSSYTYNNRGQIRSKTDARGLITTYIYNDRGLETSRTEASGTSLARIITTEWDQTHFLPTRVIEPTRTTLYSYDDRGRELSRQTTSH